MRLLLLALASQAAALLSSGPSRVSSRARRPVALRAAGTLCPRPTVALASQAAALLSTGPSRVSSRARTPVAVRAAGTLCPRPTGPRPVGQSPFAIDALPADAILPKLIVFDLDHCLWTPELYTLRNVGPSGPRADADVWLVEGALQVLHELASSERWRRSGVLLAVASRTNKPAWARALLARMAIPVAGGEPAVPLGSLLSLVEIRAGSKLAHFERLAELSSVAYDEMLFFDDARDGKYGNCEPVSKLGVLSVHTPRGLTPELFQLGLREYHACKRERRGTALVLPRLETAAARVARCRLAGQDGSCIASG
jgi:magnesium-dependent phosphatase 1